MVNKMTKKQETAIKRDLKNSILDIKITLEYSIKLLEDYQGDLKIELKELNSIIRKSKNKLKKLEEKLIWKN